MACEVGCQQWSGHIGAPLGLVACLELESEATSACQALSDSIRRLERVSPAADASVASDKVTQIAVSETARTSLRNVSSLLGKSQKVSQELVLQLLLADVPARLVNCLHMLEFEAQKDAMQLFGVVLRLREMSGVGEQILKYMRDRQQIYSSLLQGCGSPEIFPHCAQMLRSCCYAPQLVEALLSQGAVTRLMELATHSNFDISSESFFSLKELLLEQKSVSAAYLEANFEDVMSSYNKLLVNDDYVIQRQALRLLSDVLIDQSFVEVMLMYAGNYQFLQIHMNLLRDESNAIQIDAFHVFKVFVANNRMPRRVRQILAQNADRLVKLLLTFRMKRKNDAALAEDLLVVIKLLEQLEPFST